MLVAHTLFWAASKLVGSFEIQDGIDKLKWYVDGEWFGDPPQGLVTNAFVLLGLLYGGGCLLHTQFHVWNAWKTAGPRRKLSAELDAQEAAWKMEFRQPAEIGVTYHVVASKEDVPRCGRKASEPTAGSSLWSISELQ